MTANCSMCNTALAQSDVLYTPRGDIVCAACHEKAMAASQGIKLPTLLIVAAAFVLVPFVLSAAEVEIVNGKVVHYRDYVAVAMGIAGLATAIWNLVKDGSKLAMGGGAAIALLASYHIAHGFGVLT